MHPPRHGFRVEAVRTPAQVSIAGALFRRYAEWLDIDLSFQDFETELATLPGQYSPPTGELLIAIVEEQPAGCVALRMKDEGTRTAEMKRLYVCDEFRGLGIGRTLIERILRIAQERHFRYVRLDSMSGRMDAAIALYRQAGFQPIPPYCFNPHPNATYWELNLSDWAANLTSS